MSVLILQGPGAERRAPCCAGHDVQLVRCSDLGSLIAGLRAAQQADTEMVLLDSGALDPDAHRAQWPALRAALDDLHAPYIELHADPGDELESWLHPQHLPIATVITPGDHDRAYAMSVAIASRRLDGTRQH